MAKILHESTRNMTQLCKKVVHLDVRWSIVERVSVIGHFFKFIWDRIVVCSTGRSSRYRRLQRRSSSSPLLEVAEDGTVSDEPTTTCGGGVYDTDQDSVTLKISLLGDCQIGKTSFVVKYVGDEQEKRSLEMTGLNLMDKTLAVQGARISFRIWDVGGDKGSVDHIPIACKDAVAILFMFDLTSRCTLNSVVGWYSQARKWNQEGKRAVRVLYQ
ncbi:septum-promoting GTP-binding protein 1 isoform X2 [Ziziphus jujuba]|uniref:Septum-promoting GTP-binding protein 1 isoform X2 n=1 Tax=Ziziphus jujuba TaxID=326968 RepID=A0ABM3I8Y5_ZIZJJ|nr:septum-promoting GTP-binding protein 1 isoform X2 [Ziziphus jujuba]